MDGASSVEIGQSVAKARAATETRNETMNGGGFIGKSLLCSVHEFRHLAVAVGEFLLLDAHAMQQGEVKIGERDALVEAPVLAVFEAKVSAL